MSVPEEVKDAADARLKSPLLGTFIFTFAVLHWREVIILSSSLPYQEKITAVETSLQNWSTPLTALAISVAYLLLNGVVKEVALTMSEVWGVAGNRARLFAKTYDQSYISETAKYLVLAKACRFVTLLRFKMPNEFARLESLALANPQDILDFYAALEGNDQGYRNLPQGEWNVILGWFNDGSKHKVDWANESMASIWYKLPRK